MILVKFNDNYADEFDVDGFRLYTKENWIKIEALISAHFKENGEWEFYFGTNEGIEYYDLETLVSTLVISEVSEEEVKTLIKLFPRCESYGYGIFPNFEDCIFV